MTTTGDISCFAAFASYYPEGESSTCPIPSCSGYHVEVVDSWVSRLGKKHQTYGHSLKIHVNSAEYDGNMWSMILGVNSSRMFVSSWNVWFKDVFEGADKSTIVVQQKHVDEPEQKDLHGQYSFNIVVDWLRTPDLPEIFFFERALEDFSCISNSPSGFAAAIEKRGKVKDWMDVNTVVLTERGGLRVK